MEERATRPFQTRIAAVAVGLYDWTSTGCLPTGAGTTPPGPASSPMKRHEERGTRDEAQQKRPHPFTSVHDPIRIVFVFLPITINRQT